MKRICVYCGSGAGENSAFARAARDLGKLLAQAQIGLVYGGGDVGLIGLRNFRTSDFRMGLEVAHDRRLDAAEGKIESLLVQKGPAEENLVRVPLARGATALDDVVSTVFGVLLPLAVPHPFAG